MSGTDGRDQILTINSGDGHTTAINKPTGLTISSRNQPSFNIGSFSNDVDSTIQMDTIGPIKPTCFAGPPQTTKNMV